MRTEGAVDHLACSAKCGYWAERESACNSYSFKGLLDCYCHHLLEDKPDGEGGHCSMAVLGFLEEVLPAEAEQVDDVDDAADDDDDEFSNNNQSAGK